MSTPSLSRTGGRPAGHVLATARELAVVRRVVVHGDDDQIVPYADSAPLSADLLQNGTLETYAGFPHGMPTTQAGTIDADLLESIRS